MGAVRVLPGYRVLKDNGDVCTDATATFYLAGTTTLQEVFSDRNLSVSLGSTVSASSTGVFTTDIFVSDAISVKVIIAGTGYTSDTIDYLTVATSGALSFSGTIYPSVTDGGALGTTSYMWSDLFLASGGVINWNGGDVTATHSANLLTFAGASSGYAFDANLVLSSGVALSWASGDVTVTHSTNALAFAGAASGYSFDMTLTVTTTSASVYGLVAKNTTDNASVAALKIEGDRATMASNDEVYASWVLSNSAGTQTEFARITGLGNTLTAASEVGNLLFSLVNSGSMAARMVLTPTALRPNANDGIALGTATVSFADLFLASGAVLNFNNGGVTLTHNASLDEIAVAGGALRAPIPISSETTGTLTAANSQDAQIIATGGITLPANVMAAGAKVFIDGGGTARTITRGSGLTMYVNGTDSATATLAANGTMTAHYRTTTVCILSGNVS